MSNLNNMTIEEIVATEEVICNEYDLLSGNYDAIKVPMSEGTTVDVRSWDKFSIPMSTKKFGVVTPQNVKTMVKVIESLTLGLAEITQSESSITIHFEHGKLHIDCKSMWSPMSIDESTYILFKTEKDVYHSTIIKMVEFYGLSIYNNRLIPMAGLSDNDQDLLIRLSKEQPSLISAMKLYEEIISYDEKPSDAANRFAGVSTRVVKHFRKENVTAVMDQSIQEAEASNNIDY